MSYLKKYNKYRLKQLAGSLPSDLNDNLLSIINSCIQYGFSKKIKPILNLNKSFRNNALLAMTRGTQGSYLKTRLMYAILNDDTERVGILVGSNINAIDEFGRTALLTAIESRKPDIVRYLLTIPNIDVNYSIPDYIADYIPTERYTNSTQPYNALKFACIKNYIDIIELLLDKGADVNSAQDEFMSAIRDNNIELVELFIRYNINLNFTWIYPGTIDGAPRLWFPTTPLQEATESGNPEMITLLRENGATVTI
jgi:ankyrin repeat protein